MKRGKGKGGVDPVHTLKAHGGNGGTVLLIIDFGINGGEVSLTVGPI